MPQHWYPTSIASPVMPNPLCLQFAVDLQSDRPNALPANGTPEATIYQSEHPAHRPSGVEAAKARLPASWRLMLNSRHSGSSISARRYQLSLSA